MQDIKPIQRDPVLTDRVYENLKAWIVEVNVEPGTQLVERDIAARMGVSKSPVRDALQRLAGEGLVSRSGLKGLAVRRLLPEEADEIYALRELLEAFAVELATPQLSPEDHRELRSILDECRLAIDRDDRSRLAALNRRFHGFFAQRSGNRTLAQVLASLNDRVRIISVLGWRRRPSMRTEYQEHLGIAEACISGDTKEAVARTRAHIHAFRSALNEGFI